VTPVPRAPALLHAGFERDPQVALDALRPEPGARILLVDAYGGAEAALAYLALAPARVEVAALIDRQGVAALLELELNAAACFERLDVLRLLGLLRASRGERIELYLGLRDVLTAEARTFWDQHRAVLAAGIYNNCAGATLGRLLRNLLWTHLPAEAYRGLLYGQPEDRLAVFDHHIADRVFWRSALRLCALRGQLAEPGHDGVETFGGLDPVAALRRMVAAGLWTSPVWSRAFCNDSGVLATLPAHLRTEGLEAVRRHLDRLTGEVRSVEDALAAPDPSGYDIIDLCNLLDYQTPSEGAATLEVCARSLRPGGRLTFCCARADRLELPVPPGMSIALDAEARAREADHAPLCGHRRVLRRLEA
jgi:hypothetical protein